MTSSEKNINESHCLNVDRVISHKRNLEEVYRIVIFQRKVEPIPIQTEYGLTIMTDRTRWDTFSIFQSF